MKIISLKILVPLMVSASALLFLTGSSYAAETAYFLVGHHRGFYNEGYVLPLRKVEHIAAARAQLELPMDERRNVYAEIAAGGDGINRNFLVPGKTRWSWHVTNFLAFYQGGSAEMGSGSPVIVERDVDLWMESFDGKIGFLGWKLQRELSLEEVFAASIRILPGMEVEIHWPSLGTNYVYTVEVAEPPHLTMWMPAAGTWPITGTNWVDESPAASLRLYRVSVQSVMLPPTGSGRSGSWLAPR